MSTIAARSYRGDSCLRRRAPPRGRSAQSRRGLARVEDAAARSRDGVHETPRRRRDAAHALEEVQRDAARRSGSPARVAGDARERGDRLDPVAGAGLAVPTRDAGRAARTRAARRPAPRPRTRTWRPARPSAHAASGTVASLVTSPEPQVFRQEGAQARIASPGRRRAAPCAGRRISRAPAARAAPAVRHNRAVILSVIAKDPVPAGLRAGMRIRATGIPVAIEFRDPSSLALLRMTAWGPTAKRLRIPPAEELRRGMTAVETVLGQLQHPQQRLLRRLPHLLGQEDLRALVAQAEVELLERVSFMNGHSLQRQPLSGGTGMYSRSGASFFIWWMIPSSVAIGISSPARSSRSSGSSASSRRGPRAGGSARGIRGARRSSRRGSFAFSRRISRSENCSWTMQVPGQSVIGRPSVFERNAPRCRSGAKRISRSGGIDADDLLRVRGGHDDVRERLHRGRAVDVRQRDGAGVLLPPAAERVGGAGVLQRAAGLVVGQDDFPCRVQNLGGLGHEPDAGEGDDRRVALLGLAGQVQGVADEIREVLDGLFLVVMGEKDCVFLSLERDGSRVPDRASGRSRRGRARGASSGAGG